MKLGFGQIEAWLREMHSVDATKADSFRARLRYLQQRVDIGIPRAGRGRRANFTVGHALLFALALEFEQFGMTPERVAATFEAFGMEVENDTLREAVYEAADRIGSDRPAVLLWFFPEALSDATRAQGWIYDLAASTIGWSELSQIPAKVLAANGSTRLAIVNLSALVSELIEHLGSDASALAHALIAWANNEEVE